MQEFMQSPMLPLVLMFVVMYFFFLRPKQNEMKKIEEMRKALKRGDKVMTVAGILGVVQSVEKDVVTLKVAENVKLDFEKSAIVRLVVDKTEETEKK